MNGKEQQILSEPNLHQKNMKGRELFFYGIIYFSAAITVLVLAVMLFYIVKQGIGKISWEFLLTSPSVLKNNIGIFPNIINTIWIVFLSLLVVTPVGVGAAIYLNEYANSGIFTTVIQFAIQTLSGIPSIIYGLFGAIFFGITLGLDYSIMAGSLTMSIMTLPVMISTVQEALQSVPEGYREGALGLGVTKWYMLRTIILPSALPGMITAVILTIGRIVSESAALIFTAGIGTALPRGLQGWLGHTFQSGATLTVELYQYAANRGDNETAFGIAFVLLVIVLVMNMLTKFLAKIVKKG